MHGLLLPAFLGPVPHHSGARPFPLDTGYRRRDGGGGDRGRHAPQLRGGHAGPPGEQGLTHDGMYDGGAPCLYLQGGPADG